MTENTCPACQRLYTRVPGCDATTLELTDGSVVARIPYGSEELWQDYDLPERCRDCRAEMGEQHHVNCAMEQCPSCGGQLLACGHGEAYPGGLRAWV